MRSLTTKRKMAIKPAYRTDTHAGTAGQLAAQPHVMKFGGASLVDASSVRNVAAIIASHTQPTERPLVVVVSAMAKTTNALEELAQAAATGREQDVNDRLAAIRQFHLEVANGLFDDTVISVFQLLEDLIDELRRVLQGILLLGDFPPRFYDVIMGFGERLSCALVHRYLQQGAPKFVRIPAGDLILTDARYRSARVLRQQTDARIRQRLLPLLAAGRFIITEGYVAQSAEGHPTTLGREGSDYTAALLGAALPADLVTIWKDVPGVMSADPKLDAAAELLPALSFETAATMSFLGASVLHPNTLRPLHEANIPLYVRSFQVPEAPGTSIQLVGPHPAGQVHPRIRMERTGLALLQLRAHDLQFLSEDRLYQLLSTLSEQGYQVHAWQPAPTGLDVVIGARYGGLTDLAASLEEIYRLQLYHPVQMISVLTPASTDFPAADACLMLQYRPGELIYVKLQQTA